MVVGKKSRLPTIIVFFADLQTINTPRPPRDMTSHCRSRYVTRIQPSQCARLHHSIRDWPIVGLPRYSWLCRVAIKYPRFLSHSSQFCFRHGTATLSSPSDHCWSTRCTPYSRYLPYVCAALQHVAVVAKSIVYALYHSVDYVCPFRCTFSPLSSPIPKLMNR